MGYLIRINVLFIMASLLIMIYSSVSFAEEVTGIVKAKEFGNFVLIEESGEKIQIYTGSKDTTFVPKNYRTLLDDKVKVTYVMQTLNHGAEAGEPRPVAKIIEVIEKSSEHVDGDIVCEINSVGRRWVMATLVDRPLYVRLELWSRETLYFPKGYELKAGDIVSMYIDAKGDEWVADKYRNLVMEVRKITDSEKEKYLENLKKKKELKEASRWTSVEALLLALDSIHFTGIRNTAKQITESDYCNNKRLTDKIAEVLKAFIAEPDKSEIAVDAMAWCCMALQKSMDDDYIPILQQVKSSKVDRKIRKHAKKALKAFKKAKA